MTRELSAGRRAGVDSGGLLSWLLEWAEGADAETDLLRRNGALEAAAARDALVANLFEVADAVADEKLTVAEAAARTGKNPETIRRRIRRGELPAERHGERGQYRIRAADVQPATSGDRGGYQPGADAQDIARRRRSP